MVFNLINEQWIPVRRRSGMRDKIAPSQVTSDLDNPVTALDFPRPDFNGAMIQFLIGLVQTATPPEDEDHWYDWFTEPPTPEELATKFAPVSHAFNLDGDGPRFMQDGTVLKELKNDSNKSIDNLLINEPQGHFEKNKPMYRMCLSCCSAAIMTLQTNSPSGWSRPPRLNTGRRAINQHYTR